MRASLVVLAFAAFEMTFVPAQAQSIEEKKFLNAPTPAEQLLNPHPIPPGFNPQIDPPPGTQQSLNPQPIPPGVQQSLNPHPIPPGVQQSLNPQPIPPGNQVQIKRGNKNKPETKRKTASPQIDPPPQEQKRITSKLDSVSVKPQIDPPPPGKKRRAKNVAGFSPQIDPPPASKANSRTNLDRFDLGPNFVNSDSTTSSRTARGTSSSKGSPKATISSDAVSPAPLPNVSAPTGGFSLSAPPQKPK